MDENCLPEHNDVLANRARPAVDDSGGSPAMVGETVIFRMKDNFHEFSIDLETLLGCLAFAQSQGAVPQLPSDWWIWIHNRYNLGSDA